MSVRGFNTGSGIEQYDYDYLANKPAAPTKESIGLGNVDNTSDMDKPVSTLQEQALNNKVDKVPGMGLSSEDYTSAEKEKLGDLPTNTELEAVLTGKASAETVAALESAVNDPDNGLETKAPAITNTASGAIASFADGADGMPVKKLVVNVEPAQDLHGYGSPWPAGGGRNLFDPSTARLGTNITYADGIWTFAPMSATQILDLPFNDTSYDGKQISISFDIWGSNNATFRFDGQPDSVYPGGTDFADKTIYVTATKQRVAYSGTFLENTTGFRLFRTSALDGATTVTVYVSNIQLELGSSTAYSPYSNICPISGWTGAEIKRDGVNRFIYPYAETAKTVNGVTFTVNSDGSITVSGTATGGTATFALLNSTSFYNTNKILNGETVTMSGCPSGGSTSTYYLSGYRVINSGGVTTYDDGSGSTFTWSPGIAAYNVSIVVRDGTSLPSGGVVFKPQLELGSNASAYQQYQGEVISVTFPSEAGTVYGATLTVNPDRTGTLVVDKRYITIDENTGIGKESTGWAQNYEAFYLNVAGNNGKKVEVSSIPYIISNQLACVSYNTLRGSNAKAFSVTFTASGAFIEWLSTSATVEEEKARITNNPIEVCYELATPITYTLTETEIDGILSTLYGTNNIWADCGDSTVEYTADTKLYIQQLTQPTEDDMTADHAISAGTFFQLGNTLYLATSQIAAGATITPGTNATKLSLADALNQLNA